MRNISEHFHAAWSATSEPNLGCAWIGPVYADSGTTLVVEWRQVVIDENRHHYALDDRVLRERYDVDHIAQINFLPRGAPS